MDKYLWLFPILFMIHDMEEVIGIVQFVKENGDDIIRMYPFTEKYLAQYRNINTSTFSLGVYEEFLVIVTICLAVEITGCEFLRGVWLGALICFTIHLVGHIIQSIAIHRYIPALITSIICLPPSVLLIKSVWWHMNYSGIAGLIFGSVGLGLNLIFAHKLMKRYAITGKVI